MWLFSTWMHICKARRFQKTAETFLLMFDLSNLLSAPYKTFSLEGAWEECGSSYVAQLPGFQMVFSERHLSIEYPLSRIHFLSFTNISCEGVEIRDGLRRRKAEGLVQQQ